MIFIGLGSNMGNKEKNIHEALVRLQTYNVKILKTSSLIVTAPWGNLNQEDFVNAVAEVAFDGTPLQLLDACLEVEKQMGRIREEKWGPRIIDLDIIEFHRFQIQSERLILPHPFYTQRAFVLEPLRELYPDWQPTMVDL